MAELEVVAKTKIVREKGCHYFLDGEGNVFKQNRATKERAVVFAHAFKPEKGYFYCVDANGNVARGPRVVRGKKKVEEAKPEAVPVAG